MAQLRDKQTSELIAEGTPEELVLVAEELGADEVLFDGVGAGFDPGAVKAAHAQNRDGLAGAARAAKAGSAERASLEASSTRHAELETRARGELAEAAQRRLEAARDRVTG